MTAASGPDRVPDVTLERYRLGELPADEAARVTARLATDATLRARLASLEQSDRLIGAQYPAGWLADRVRARLDACVHASRTRAPARLRTWAAPAALAAAVTVALVLLPRPLWWPASGTPGARPAAGDRVKGLRPTLTLFRRTPGGSETLADGAIAQPGDVIRLGYQAAGRAFGVILSIDGRGVVTVHLPAGGDRAAALRAGSAVLLDSAYELDDAPRWECFYFVTADRPFDVAPVVEAAGRTARTARGARPPGPLLLPAGFDQFVISLEKRSS
jgi:anti-sigma factor RsiW